MKVADILAQSKETRFSLEVYPPRAVKSASGPTIQQHLTNIFDTVEHLSKYRPIFVSVTYNPEGRTRATSIPIAAIIKQRFNTEAVAHLTSVATPKSDIRRTLDVLDYFSIDNVLALRGDMTEGRIPDKKCPRYASELVERISKARKDMCIGVACYPEGHPECIDKNGKIDLARDLTNFKTKVEKGADFAITQLFLDNEVYFDFVKRARAVGIEIPILPGILPLVSYSSLNITKKLGVSIPPALEQKLKDHKDEPEEILNIGVEHSIRQCKGFMGKVPCIHFYTMDKWKEVDLIMKELI